jgi:hypothetical protein
MRQLLQETTMTTITLDIPDALAERLVQRREQLPQLLAMALELFPGEAPFSLSMFPPDHPVFAEMINFLPAAPRLPKLWRSNSLPRLKRGSRHYSTRVVKKA